MIDIEIEILKALAEQIGREGPIPTARISSAQSRGTSKKYPYWGVARWEVRVGSKGLPVCSPQKKAQSSRRSMRQVKIDLEKVCKEEGRSECYDIGKLRWETAFRFLKNKESIKDLAFRVASLFPDDPIAKEIVLDSWHEANQ